MRPLDSLAHALSAFDVPELAARARLVLLSAAAIGVVVMAARVALPLRMPRRAAVLTLAQSGFVYLTMALTMRFFVQHHRSRLQMAILLGVVVAVELARYRQGEARLRFLTWLCGSLAVCGGVLAAKWALEPGALTDAWLRL